MMLVQTPDEWEPFYERRATSVKELYEVRRQRGSKLLQLPRNEWLAKGSSYDAVSGRNVVNSTFQ